MTTTICDFKLAGCDAMFKNILLTKKNTLKVFVTIVESIYQNLIFRTSIKILQIVRFSHMLFTVHVVVLAIIHVMNLVGYVQLLVNALMNY